MKALPPSLIQDWESATLSQNHSVTSLMEQAVNGCFHEITRRFSHPRPILFLCGKGNNGNDGLWLAGRFIEKQWPVHVLLSHPPEKRTSVKNPLIDQALHQAETWSNFSSNTSKKVLETLYHSTPRLIVIDALLGLGVKGSPRDPFASILKFCSQQKQTSHFYISIDTPSGLDPDTGEIPSPTSSSHSTVFPADLTIAIGAIKQGCLKDKARPYVGRLASVPISLDPDYRPSSPFSNFPDYFTADQALSHFKPLPASTYKNRQGEISFWSGSKGYYGAAILSTRAALHSGAGLIRLFTHSEAYPHLATQTPEVMVHSLPSCTSTSTADDLFFRAQAVVIGPGIGQSKEAEKRFCSLLPRLQCPAVIDADGLTFLANNLSLLKQIDHPLILTPHHGEMRKLLGHAFEERESALKEWLNSYPNTILVLKGPNTLVGTSPSSPPSSISPSSQNSSICLSYNGSGNPGMATGGTGDVLAGIIGGLLAQGYSPWNAARLGTFWHGYSADFASLTLTEHSLVASNIIDNLGPSLQNLTL